MFACKLRLVLGELRKISRKSLILPCPSVRPLVIAPQILDGFGRKSVRQTYKKYFGIVAILV
jgi:hypothetical protein